MSEVLFVTDDEIHVVPLFRSHSSSCLTIVLAVNYIRLNMETRNLLPFFSSGKCLTRTEKIVLRAVWFEGFATRSEIGASTGLSRPTIIEAINGLRNRNLIHSSQRKHGLIGRDPECLAVNSKALYGVGVDIGGTKTSTALVDLRGEIVAETTLPTTRNGAEALVDLVAQMKRHQRPRVFWWMPCARPPRRKARRWALATAKGWFGRWN